MAIHSIGRAELPATSLHPLHPGGRIAQRVGGQAYCGLDDDLAGPPGRGIVPRERPMIPLPATNRGALRDLAEHALSRAAGGPLVLGNAVRVLRNASENYPAWLAALATAKQHVCFENYIFSDDVTGRRIASALAERAQRGVRVRVLYDWLGGLGEGASRIARGVAAAGVA